jgi:hypothetical protein
LFSGTITFMKRAHAVFFSCAALYLVSCGDKSRSPGNQAAAEDDGIKETVITFIANGQKYELSKTATKNHLPSSVIHEERLQQLLINGGDGSDVYFNFAVNTPPTSGPVSETKGSAEGKFQLTLGEASYHNLNGSACSMHFTITGVDAAIATRKRFNGTFHGSLSGRDGTNVTITDGVFTGY